MLPNLCFFLVLFIFLVCTEKSNWFQGIALGQQPEDTRQVAGFVTVGHPL